MPDLTVGQLTAMMEPISDPPSLKSVNGFGVGLFGRLTPIRQQPHIYIATTMVTALFVPIFPIGLYVCQSAGDRRTRFYGKLRSRDFWRAIGGRQAALFYIGAVAHSLAVGTIIVLAICFAVWVSGGHQHSINFRY